jgi:glycine/D-amino acid oxidase-like deaminating enzyme
MRNSRCLTLLQSPRSSLSVVAFSVSSAEHLARRGISTILVNDGPLARGASGRSLSWLNSSRKRSSEYQRLRMIEIDRYRALSAKYPYAGWLRFDGGLTWDADDSSNEIANVFAHEREIGYDAQHLSTQAIAAVTPGIDVRTVTPQGAIFNPGEGWADVSSVSDEGRATVTVTDGRAIGITTTSGRLFGADAVLVATAPRFR